MRPPTRVGLALAALGRPGYINVGHATDLDGAIAVPTLEAHAHAVLDAAWAAGVRFFDAARSYGRPEEFLGSWLTVRGLDPPAVTVGSKWGYTYTAGWRVDAEVNEVKDLSIETLRRQAAESRQLLGARLCLYQIHSATIESGVLEDAAVRDELARLRAGGLYIGFTATGPRQRDTIERAVQAGGFDAVQATWNLLDPSAGPALAAARAAGLGVIVKEAVANGRLTARGDVSELLRIAAAVEVTPDALALAAVLAQPWADVVLSGAASSATPGCSSSSVGHLSGRGSELRRNGGAGARPQPSRRGAALSSARLHLGRRRGRVLLSAATAARAPPGATWRGRAQARGQPLG